MKMADDSKHNAIICYFKKCSYSFCAVNFFILSCIANIKPLLQFTLSLSKGTLQRFVLY